MVWNLTTLQAVRPDQLAAANEHFMGECKMLGLAQTGIEALTQLLAEAKLLEPSPLELYGDLEDGNSSLSQIEPVIEKITDYLEDSDENARLAQTIRGAIEQGPIFSSLNSFGGLLRTLIFAMAASSKLGAGTEESCVASCDAAYQFAKELIAKESNRNHLRRIALALNRQHKTQSIDHSSPVLLPVYYLFGILLTDESQKSKAILGDHLCTHASVQGFKQIALLHSQPECLTECVIKAKTHLMTEEVENPAFYRSEIFTYEQRLSNLARQVIEDSRRIIQERINDSCRDASHIGHAHAILSWSFEKPSQCFASRGSFDSVADSSLGSTSLTSTSLSGQSFFQAVKRSSSVPTVFSDDSVRVEDSFDANSPERARSSLEGVSLPLQTQ